MRKNKINVRKKIMKTYILNNKNINLSVYRLLETNVLDKYINNLNKDFVYNNVKKNTKYTSEEQFVFLIDRIINFFNDNIPYLSNNIEIIMELILKSDNKILDEFLNCKIYLHNNDYIDYFVETIYKIICFNFIENSQYCMNIRELLINKKLYKENIEEYNLQEIKKVMNLLSEICYINKSSKFNLIYLFSNINDKLKSIDLKKSSFNKNSSKIIDYMNMQYSIIIDEYNKIEYS